MDINAGVSNVQLFLSESRYDEGTLQINTALQNIAMGENGLDTIENAANTAGDEFQVSLAAKDSGIYTAYAAVLERIQRLRDLLGLYRSILEEQQTEILNESLLPSSDITLEITPGEAFVGDEIIVEGTLSTKGNPLGNRQVEIMVNGSQYLTITTDAQGHYLSSLQIPYFYLPEMQIQSLYYPQGDDAGVYELALSSPVSLKVLFYEAILTLKTDTEAYPGRATAISGQFN